MQEEMLEKLMKVTKKDYMNSFYKLPTENQNQYISDSVIKFHKKIDFKAIKKKVVISTIGNIF